MLIVAKHVLVDICFRKKSIDLSRSSSLLTPELLENPASVCKWPYVSAETGSPQAGRSHRLDWRLTQTENKFK